jgi:hypothetical protein
MKLSSTTSALALRDSCFEAMDALNQGLVECLGKLPGIEEDAVRLGVGMAMNGVLENLLEPLLRGHPELEVSEDLWGEIARRRRIVRTTLDAAAETADPDSSA